MNRIDRLKVWAGAGAASTEINDLKDAAEQGKSAMAMEAMTTGFTRLGPQAAEKFRDAGKGLDSVSTALGNLQNVRLDMSAISRIHYAIATLDKPGIVQKDSALAAAAFGELFLGFGKLASQLPSPANSYAAILENCGNFFSAKSVSHANIGGRSAV